MSKARGNVDKLEQVSTSELDFLAGVTSDVQAQLDGKEVSGSVATHASDTSTHGVVGDVVGTSDTQTLTNKTITAVSNTITTAPSGDLSATELNAALAELQAQITSLEATIGGLGVVNVQTGYLPSTAVTAGSGEDFAFVDVPISLVSAITNCQVVFDGGARTSAFLMSNLTQAADSAGSVITSQKCTARLTTTTNLRISAPSGAATIQGRWQVIDHEA